ncbi:MAG TPA: adenylate/guanylate cyclase domain-containing protein [Candidatus Tectomicrobia bacterium]|nr:adenylate/guanylate cyclase domain-containing protein [Candidatus Tectomicrobia bacterium]
MDYNAVLEQVVALLQLEKRLSYRVLKRRLQLDDEMLEDLKEDLIYAKQLAVDEEGKVLVWAGGAGANNTPAVPTREPVRPPRSYTPPYLAEKILTSKTALEGERKQVTVLFADLKSSMELLADRDPEEARQLLDPVLEHLMAAVHRYEGTVNQVMGDGIMALFGAPLAHEDHAARACYAALHMQEAIGRYAEGLRRQQGLDVQIRVGLNSGEVVVRAIGNDLHMDYTAVGQTTHLAARMEQLARPGTALLTADTLRLVEGYVEVKPLGPVPVKGLPEPVEVYELLRAGPVRSRLQAAVARGLTRFVGRDTELEQLRQALARAGAGHGQVVAGVGEAGVGKSRLLYEFTRSHHTHGWLLLSSNSVSYGKATAYLPAIDLLKSYFSIEPRDDTRRMREKVTGKLLTLDRALEPMLPALLALLEVPVEDPQWQAFDPPQRRRRTLEAIKLLLLRESQVQPLCLVFEDLHWIDAETQALLDSLVESLPTARLLLLVNYRPEYQHGWGSKTYYTQLRLDPLPPASAAEFLQMLLGDDPSLAPLNQLLIARTQGNPFFLEESVRTLVETGVLVGERGAYRLAKPLEGLQVPATVQAVLAARIDRLPPEEKRLLQTAAVIGTEVPWPLLQDIADEPDEALHRGLAYLQAAEFLYETSLFPEREYTFKHALTHEVAYGGLLRERQRLLHSRIVAAIEQHKADRLADQVERLAHHALRGELWDKAVAYLRQAGDKVVARSASREAVACFEQALVALEHLPESRARHEQAIDVRFGLRHSLSQRLEYGRVLTYLREAEGLAQALGDQHRLGWVAAYLTDCFGATGDPQRAVEVGQRALVLAGTLGDAALQVVLHLFLGRVCYALGDYPQAIALLRQNVVALEGALLWERFGLPGLPAVMSRDVLARCLAEVGAFSEGLARGEESLRMAEAVNHPNSLINACYGIGYVNLRKGEFHQAIPWLERGLEVGGVWDIPLLLSVSSAALGYAYVLAGRVSDALPLLEQSVSTEAMEFVRGRIHVWLSEAYLRLGRPDEALAVAKRGLELCRAHAQQGEQAWALRLLGEIYAQCQPPQAELAEAAYREALALAEALGMRPLQAHCHLGLGTLYAKTRQWEQARTELSAAIALYRAVEMTFWLPQAEAALAQAEGR